MSKKFNKNLALIALVSTLTLGSSAALADTNENYQNRPSPSMGWKLPTGTKIFTGIVKSINNGQLTLSHYATNTPDIIINTSATTTYLSGTLSDITVGTRLSGVGTKQADGSFNAISIRLNPANKTSIQKRQHAVGVRPFFGTITGINDNIITINQVHGKAGGTSTPTTIKLNTDTVYTTGDKSSLAIGTSIAGIGIINSDKTITALKISPNSTKVNILSRGYSKHRNSR